MITVDVRELSPQLVGLLQNRSDGEPIIIVQDGQPLAEIKPLQPAAREPRPWGLARGQFRVPDDFNAPLPEDVLGAFAPRIAGLHSGKIWLSDDFDAPLDITPQD